MRLVLAALLTVTSGLHAAHAATQQQCEALLKPVEEKVAGFEKMRGDKPTPQDCARSSDLIKLYTTYQKQADGMNCPFAYVAGQKIGGAAERADMLADIKQAHNEKCR